MAMSKAFDGFILFTFIFFLAWFLLAIQLGRLSLDSSYKKWHALLEGNGRFPVMSTRTSPKSVKFTRESFFANNRLDISYYNLTSLKEDLHRDRHPYKWYLVYADMSITVGGFLLWIMMILALCCKRLEKFFACGRGLFLILVGVFGLLCSLFSLGVFVLTLLDDMDNYDDKLVKALETVEGQLEPFYADHPNLTECSRCDNNDDGVVKLSPHTWFLIILECLIRGGKTLSDILPEPMMGHNETRLAITTAEDRESEQLPLVHINEVEYSRWMLMQLGFCPEKTIKHAIHAFLAFVCIFLPIVALFMWKEYGSRKSDKKEKKDPEKQEPVITGEPPEVVGSNKQLADIIEGSTDPGLGPPNPEMVDGQKKEEQTKDNPPGEQNKDNPPGEQDKTNAPGEQNMTNAPGEQSATNPPVEQDKKNPPGQQNKKRSVKANDKTKGPEQNKPKKGSS